MIKRISSLLQCILIPVVLFLLSVWSMSVGVVIAVLISLVIYTVVGVYYISDILTKWWSKARF